MGDEQKWAMSDQRWCRLVKIKSPKVELIVHFAKVIVRKWAEHLSYILMLSRRKAIGLALTYLTTHINKPQPPHFKQVGRILIVAIRVIRIQSSAWDYLGVIS